MNKEYIVFIDVTEQVSEDQWMSRTKMLKVSNQTTIGEIKEWYRNHKPVGTIHFSISELETQTTNNQT